MKTEQIPFSSLPGFSTLFKDYVEGHENLQPFYNGSYNSESAIVGRCDHLRSRLRENPELGKALREQNSRWRADDLTFQNIDKLSSGNSLAVVTGQQIGLLINPLYIIYKAITAIQLARDVSEKTGFDCVPIFWMATGDHDFEEIRSASFPNENGLVSYDITRPSGYSGPVGRILLEPEIEKLSTKLRSMLPAREGLESVIQLVSSTYKAGRSLEDAFGSLITKCFEGTGIIVVSPDDAKLKKIVRPLFRQELEDSQGIYDALSKQSGELEGSYKIQVEPTLHNLFYVDEISRSKISYEGGSWVAHNERIDEFTLLKRLDAKPEMFSPNVVLRPLMQDSLFPTVAYVAGPGETSYFAQLKGVYEWADMEMPIIYPRASVTLLESKISKSLERFGLKFQDLQHHDPNDFFKDVAIDSLSVDLEEVFGKLEKEIGLAFSELGDQVGRIDRNMKKSSKARQVTVEKQIAALKKKVVRIQKNKMSEVGGQIGDVFHHLLPQGALQERKISALFYLSRFGPNLIRDLLGHVLLDTSKHQLIKM